MKVKNALAVIALTLLPSLTQAQMLESVTALIPRDLVNTLAGAALSQLPTAGNILALASPLTDPLLGNAAVANTLTTTLFSTDALGGFNLAENQGLILLQQPLVMVIDQLDASFIGALLDGNGAPAMPF
ncbi:hypothetical protein I6N98_00850 [Spongiibacter nanhainus]|uniref:FAS1 domain-containing protein n=1 Tax=Spongiibacter nanhainus TaxID=2794344 RepID=A0A7T4UQG4_9GAMM|nr:hypothetical protein [Spongiibacter nanhainus]QQD18457.1 hypothetical protein I6N98_00850 [Spongiibacter nanhainus]